MPTVWHLVGSLQDHKVSALVLTISLFPLSLPRHLLHLLLRITGQLARLILCLHRKLLRLSRETLCLVLCRIQPLLRLALQSLFPTAHVPVVGETVRLCRLRGEVHEMAAEEKVVLGRHGHGVAHEYGAVATEGGGHSAGDAVRGMLDAEYVCG